MIKHYIAIIWCLAFWGGFVTGKSALAGGNQSHKPHWLNYRNDIPNCLCVIREYRSLLEQIKANNDKT